MVLEQGYSVADAAKSLGIATSLLYKWKEKYEAQKKSIALEESERDELKRLRKEGYQMGRYQVRHIMRRLQLKVTQRLAHSIPAKNIVSCY